MMRCASCNEVLTDKESTRKSSTTNEFLDLCDTCIEGLDISYDESMYLDELERYEKDIKEN